MGSKGKDLNMALSGLEELAERLQDAGGDLKKALTEVMDDFADTIQADTEKAIQNQNLPAHGEYSKGKTKESIIHDPKVTWQGPVASVGVGFDKTKPGAGGWLITGTPRQKPVMALQRIFGGWAGGRAGNTGQNRYIKDLAFDAKQIMLDHIEEAMEGKKK